MSGVLYNEIEPFAAQWLGNLSDAGHIARGRVDSRSIADLRAEDVRDLTQFHTFAGIGIWSHALRLAGFPDTTPCWTGSCPCQGWSNAGLKKGFDDDRHLWPEWFRLIQIGRPPLIFGEQVASKDALGWFDAVCDDLEGEGYAVGALDLPACSVGAPHKRSRLFFGAVDLNADADDERLQGLGLLVRSWGQEQHLPQARWSSEALACSVADHSRCEVSEAERRLGEGQGSTDAAQPGGEPLDGGDAYSDRAGEHAGELPGDEGQHEVGPSQGNHSPLTSGAALIRDLSQQQGLEGQFGPVREWRGPGWLNPQAARSAAEAGATRGFWGDCDWYYCRDEKFRPIEAQPLVQQMADGAPSGLGCFRLDHVGFPLVTDAPSRAGRLRAYGNAIVPQVAATFIRSFIESLTVTT